jgi:hypothetical protein
VRTLQERFVSDSLYKHHDWKGDATKFKLTDQFQVVGNLLQNAKFTGVNPVTVRAELIDAAGQTSNTGTIWFHDPWYLKLDGSQPNTFLPFDSPYNPTGAESEQAGGVFLNQREDIPGNPYYSARVQRTQAMAGFQSNFLNWAGGGADVTHPNDTTTPVIFRHARDTVKARYKAHLGSSSSMVTSPSMQRRIIRDNTGVYHMVVESADQIWYSKSADGISNWTPEVAVSEVIVGGTNRRPALTYQSNPPLLLAVWEFYTEGQGWNLHEVFYRAISPTEGPIGSVECLTSNEMYTEPPIEFWTNPCIAYGHTQHEDKGLVVWYDGVAEEFKGKTYDATTASWAETVTLRTGMANTAEFSLAPLSELNHSWHMLWIENAQVLSYAPIAVAMYPSISTVEEVYPVPGDGSLISSPSVVDVCGYDTPIVDWAETEGDFDWHVIKYKRRSSSSHWKVPATRFSGSVMSNFFTPSLTGQKCTGNIALAWASGASHIMYTRQMSGQWGSLQTLTSGTGPMITDGVSGDSREVVLSRTTTAPVYVIQRNEVSFQSEGDTKLSPEVSADSCIDDGRGLRVDFDGGGSLKFALVEPELEGRAVRFNAITDTVPMRTLSEVMAALPSRQFNGTGALRLRVIYGSSGEVPALAAMRLVVRDAVSGQVLALLGSFGSHRDTIVTITVPLSLGTRYVRLAVQTAGVIGVRGVHLERWIMRDPSGTSPSRLVAGFDPESVNRPVPKQFALHQNYPNPFNPSTQIKFDLPEPGDVSLVVYDVLGRRVAELANGYYELGYHTVVWDALLRRTDSGGQASGFASGVYFARLTIADGSGQVRFCRASKLLLLK